MMGMGGNATRVLIVDDEESQRNGLASMVSSWGFAAETAADGQEALDKLGTFAAHVMVTDLMMPRMDGFELLRRLSAQGSGPPAIVVTAFGNIETAIATMHDLGAFWFLEKPIDPRALRVLLDRAASQQRLADEAERLKRELSYQGVLADLVGRSACMQEVFSLIRQVSPSKAAVLISGESGTGKELVARAVHSLSPRAGGPFVAINCAAMPETLMESELFGHEKEPLPERSNAAPAVSNSRRTARSCSTKSATCPSLPRPNCCECSRIRMSGAWAARVKFSWT